jgi:hypothetical protein
VTSVCTITITCDSGPVFHKQLIGRDGAIGEPNGIIAVTGLPVTGSGYVSEIVSVSPLPGESIVLVGTVNGSKGIGPPDVDLIETVHVTVAGYVFATWIV